jgi:PAS domain S-box-containing protein
MVKDMLVALVALGTLWLAWRRAGPERKKLDSEMGRDTSAIISSYEEQVREMMDDRKTTQEEILELQAEVARLQDELKAMQTSNLKLETKCSVWYRAVLEVVQAPIFILSLPETKIVDCNTRASSLYGYSRGQLLQMSFTELSAEPEKTFRVLEQRITHVDSRFHRKKDGDVFPISGDVSYFLDANVSYAAVLIKDKSRKDSESGIDK